MTYREYRTRLGALKAQLEWRIAEPGRVWAVEGYYITRKDGRTYDISRIGLSGDDTLVSLTSLEEAFSWIADGQN